MIKSFKDHRLDYLIGLMIPNRDILDLNPVIAGGSALAIYRLLKMYDTDTNTQ